MRRYLSPLRYPGGKARLTRFLASLISAQEVRPLGYAEPFAGGAGAALGLLVTERVDRIYLNDLDPGIAAFWRALFSQGEHLAQRIENTVVDLSQWHEARSIYESAGRSEQADDFTLGFATFFLNRTNRSGILGARPIGGLDQTGRWKIDARFNRTDLAERVRFLASYRERVELSERDALNFLSSRHLDERVFVYVDPPYLTQGSELYLDLMSYDKHKKLAKKLAALQSPWMATYDADERVVQELYPDSRCGTFDIAHTAARQHVGNEYVVFSKDLTVSTLQGISVNSSAWLPAGFRTRTTDMPK